MSSWTGRPGPLLEAMIKASAARGELPYLPQIRRRVVLCSACDGGQGALMQRGDSASKIRPGRAKRYRRRAFGLTTAVAAHLLAVLALSPAARSSIPDRANPSGDPAPLVIVQLVHLRSPEAPATPKPEPDSAPRSKSVSLPEDPAPFNLALSDPPSPGSSAPDRPEDDEPLYRVPFRSAVGQADARLRAGLNCAHVDLRQLPQTVFDLCSTMARPPKARG